MPELMGDDRGRGRRDLLAVDVLAPVAAVEVVGRLDDDVDAHERRSGAVETRASEARLISGDDLGEHHPPEIRDEVDGLAGFAGAQDRGDRGLDDLVEPQAGLAEVGGVVVHHPAVGAQAAVPGCPVDAEVGVKTQTAELVDGFRSQSPVRVLFDPQRHGLAAEVLPIGPGGGQEREGDGCGDQPGLKPRLRQQVEELCVSCCELGGCCRVRDDSCDRGLREAEFAQDTVIWHAGRVRQHSPER